MLTVLSKITHRIEQTVNVRPPKLTAQVASADEPTLRSREWIEQQWEAARLKAKSANGAVLVLDEIQKISDWSETVKRLWDADTRARAPLKVVLLGSAPLLIQRGLTESLDISCRRPLPKALPSASLA